MAKLDYLDPSLYSTKTLIGNWFEEKSAYCRNKQNSISTYQHDYIPQEYSALSPSHLWREKLLYEGQDPRMVYDHEFPKYLDNLSTTYDLSYNHFPRCMRGPMKRNFRTRFLRYEPSQDYSLNYGNITNFGLKEAKRYQWKKDSLDPRRTLESVYTHNFVAPPKEDLIFKRYGLPVQNSSLMDETNILATQIHFRDAIQLSVPPNASLVPVERPSRCNPITWECPPEEQVKSIRRCMPPKKKPN